MGASGCVLRSSKVKIRLLGCIKLNLRVHSTVMTSRALGEYLKKFVAALHYTVSLRPRLHISLKLLAYSNVFVQTQVEFYTI